MTDIKQYEPLWGSWHVESLIGEGSFGKVYKIRKEEFGSTYYSAVKVISIPQNESDLRQLKDEGMDDASVRSYLSAFVSDIIQEIDLMSAFRGNSHVVSFEDHKVIEKTESAGWDILIRMELLTSLSERIRDKPLTADETVKLGTHICRALELCSLKNVIHRDIKPDNLFVSEYGDFKLGDFGIARQIERTMSGLSKKGTYTYMAPEVFKGDEYGASVDIYSLGIVMYRYLNQNRTPFLPDFPTPITPRDRDESLQRRMSGEAIPPIKGIDPSLNAIVLKACDFDRKSRFSNAAEMREALEKVMNGQAISYAPVRTAKTAATGEDPDATVRFFENAAEHENTEDKTHLIERGFTDIPTGADDSARTSAAEGVFANHPMLNKPSSDTVVTKHKKGDIITFGKYDGFAIKWLVLEVTNGSAFLISNDIITKMPYHKKWVHVTWENCTLRKWLNEDFYNKAFGAGEKAKIKISSIINKDSEKYRTPGGNSTQDKVFLLSIDEANSYFSSDSSRKAKAWWWLRSPGGGSRATADVRFDGSVGIYGLDAFDSSGGVRPALWINLES